MFEHILYQVQDGICTITLNRPELYNALNVKLTLELADALKQATKEEAVRVVVLTGAGSAFCSGADLKEAVKGIASYAEEVRSRYNPIIMAMRNMPKPIIGRINGVAAGAGCSLALACDVLVAAEETYFSEAFVGIGLVLDSGSGYFLPRMVGSVRAFEWATMGTKIPATQAAQAGLITRAVPLSQLDEVVNQYISYYANAPTKTIGLIKQMLNRSFHSSLEEMLECEALYQEVAGSSQDHQEGVRAFLEKRKPIFTGK